MLAETLGVLAVITDDAGIIAVAGGPKREFLGQNIGSIETIMKNGKAQIVCGTIAQNGREFSSLVVAPIITDRPIGTVALAPKKEGAELGETEINLAVTAATFLAKQMQRNT